MARYSDACIAKATKAHDEIFKLAGDPEARMLRFYQAIQDGMPPPEAAYYFLHTSAEEYEHLEKTNSVLRFMVRAFQGHIAAKQYKKLVDDQGYASGLKWLEANRPKVYGKQKIQVEIKDPRYFEKIAMVAGKLLQPDQFEMLMDQLEEVFSGSNISGSEDEGDPSL